MDMTTTVKNDEAQTRTQVGEVRPPGPTDTPDAPYARSQFETIWLRTKRYNAAGEIRGGSGGICYVYWPVHPSPGQRRVLASLGIN